MIVGAHVWIGEGLQQAIRLACQLHCQCLQIFLHNPRCWQVKKRSDQQLLSFKKELAERKLFPLIIHMPYLINLCSSEAVVRKLSLRRMALEIKEAETIGASGYVIHPGSYGESGFSPGWKRLVSNLKYFSQTPVKILLENTSGQKRTLGSCWTHFESIKDKISNVGFCLDTAHAWAAGYQLSCKEGFESMMAEIEKTIGLQYINLIHANGSAAGCGSHLDRHESLYRGRLGLEVFHWLAAEKKLGRLPFIIETPRRSLAEDKRNLRILRTIGGKYERF